MGEQKGKQSIFTIIIISIISTSIVRLVIDYFNLYATSEILNIFIFCVPATILVMLLEYIIVMFKKTKN